LTVALQHRYRVIRLDWPGQGRSGVDTGAVTPARYAQLLRGVLVQLNIESPIIIGCSIGGAAAIRYASEYPVKALVLANSGGLVEVTSASQRACRLMASAFAAGERRAWWFKPAFSLFYRSVLPTAAAQPQRARIVASAYEIAGVLAAAWRGFADPDAADHRELVCALDVPIWLAWASQDKINRFVDVEPTVRRMRRASVTQFRAGHVAFLEQPELFVQEFETFVRGLTPAATVESL
jgi:pimeloyl-ACP methyl ester carboxylesterase